MGCDTKPTIISTLHHGGDCTGALVSGGFAAGDLRNFNQEKHEYSAHGTLYSVRYTCFDGTTGDERARLHATECRQIMNVDKTRPIIQILGSDAMTLEATHTGNYVDDGATCSDQVDGVISQNVEVSGDVVNLSKIGTYTVRYNCKDSRGNSAPSLPRKVVVRQTRCPTCTIEHCPNHHTADFKCSMTHEASFEYVDAGAKCSDNIDGEVRVTVDNGVDVEKTGTYYVTYTARNSAGLWNDGKHGAGREDGDSCKDDNGKPDNRRYVRTVVIKDSLKPVISVRYKGVQVDTGLSGQDATGDKAKTYRADQDMENPADKWAKDQIVMMSEQAVQGSRMWALAGAAAAVAGLALLGMSHRRTVTSVPV